LGRAEGNLEGLIRRILKNLMEGEGRIGGRKDRIFPVMQRRNGCRKGEDSAMQGTLG
jgi:hypothetical protein